MEKKKTPFAVRAAQLSVLLPLGAFLFNYFTQDFKHFWQAFHQGLFVCYVLVLVAGAGLAVRALFGIKTHGPAGIRGLAVAGLLINSGLLVLVAILMPALARVRAHAGRISDAQMRSVAQMFKDDLMQFQTSGTVPVRTFTEQEYGAAAPVMQLANDNMRAIGGLSDAYALKVAGIDVAQCLQPQCLIDPEIVAASRSKMERLQASYQEFTDAVLKQETTVLQQLDALSVPSQVKDGFLDGFFEAKKDQTKIMEALRQVHFQYTAAVIDLLDFMADHCDACTVEDDLLVFEQDADCDEFNRLFECIQGLEVQLLNAAGQATDMAQTLDT